jgi:hypothetical protein
MTKYRVFLFLLAGLSHAQQPHKEPGANALRDEIAPSWIR